MSKTYIALIADAIASRELPPAARARLQADARTAVKDLNQRYRRALAARFAVTLGDELQCLLPTPQPVWDVARSEEHTSELQSQSNLVCRLLLEKKKRRTAAQSTSTSAGARIDASP